MEDHTVRVNDENLEQLKYHKVKWSISYNEIIGMGLKLLDGGVEDESLKSLDKNQLLIMCSSMGKELEKLRKSRVGGNQVNAEASVYKIKVSLSRVRINDSVKNLLNSGYDLFIPEITHRQAMYVKRKLKSMGFNCDYVKSEGDGKYGFLFTQPGGERSGPKESKTDAKAKSQKGWG